MQPSDDQLDYLLSRGGLGGPRQEKVLDGVHQTARARTRLRRGWLGVAVLVPAAATLLLIVGLQRDPLPDGGQPGIIAKGGPGLLVAVRRGERLFPMRPGEPIRAGDQIRLVLEHVSYPFVLVASVDGRGASNIYVPYEGSRSLPVPLSDRIEVPGSLVLDDSPGPERLFALFSRVPLDAAAVRSALAAVGARGAPGIRSTTALNVGANAQTTVLLEKVAP
jgi:hypothetical protein